MTRTPGTCAHQLFEQRAGVGALRLLRREPLHRDHQQGGVELPQPVVGAERVLLLVGVLRASAVDQ